MAQRLVVVGTSCSGKSTFAQAVATQLGIPHIELDSLHWEKNWTEAPLEVFEARVAHATDPSEWIADGNYGKVRDLLWKKAQTLIWLDYSFHVVFSRALFRTLKRSLTKEILWSGNQESIRMSFFSSQSILLWVLQTYPKSKREYPKLLSRPEYSHLKVHRFQSPKEASQYLKQLGPKAL